MNVYSYELFDNDVGGVVDSNTDLEFADVLQYLFDLVNYDFEEDAEPEELKNWNPNRVLISFKTFDFCNGSCNWGCVLPGNHRRITVVMDEV